MPQHWRGINLKRYQTSRSLNFLSLCFLSSEMVCAFLSESRFRIRFLRCIFGWIQFFFFSAAKGGLFLSESGFRVRFWDTFDSCVYKYFFMRLRSSFLCQSQVFRICFSEMVYYNICKRFRILEIWFSRVQIFFLHFFIGLILKFVVSSLWKSL